MLSSGGLGAGGVGAGGVGAGGGGALGSDHLAAREALVALGFSLAEAEERLAGVDPELPPEERVKRALRAA